MKRFYKSVSVEPAEHGWRILLDGKPVNTPAKNVLAVPTRALADAIAAEWAQQGAEIDPVSMPHLRLANTVLDGIAVQRDGVVAAVLRFGEHDLLCYRAHQPPELARRQSEAWEPLLAWAARRYGAHLSVAAGLQHIAQPPEAIAALGAAVTLFDSFSLAALHVIASITGSLVLALALADGNATPAHIFRLSRLDEDYQAEKWGVDTQAEIRARALAHELDKAAEFITHART